MIFAQVLARLYISTFSGYTYVHVIFVEVLARLNKNKFSGKTYVQVIFAHFLARLYMGNSAWYIYSLARTCAKIYIYICM